MADEGWKPPGFMSKVVGFTVAFRDWRAAGYPRRAPEWVAELFNAHCKGCDMHQPEARNALGAKGLCQGCGCHVSPDAAEPRNMLIYPTKPCPMGKFSATVEPSTEKYWPKIRKP